MRLYLVPMLAAVAFGFVPGKPASKPSVVDPKIPTLDLCLEIQALRILYLLRITPEQARRVQAVAAKLADTDRQRDKPQASDQYRHVLAGLHHALAADNQDKVEELEDELSELTESEEPELDDSVTVTTAARHHVAEVVRLLGPQQVAGFFGSIAEEVGDPQQRLVSALEEIRSQKKDDWESTRDDLADDLAWLLGGLDAGKFATIRDEVSALLTRAHDLKNNDFEKQRPDLEKAARAVGAGIDATDVLRHTLERTLARLLSNPRLAQALEARIQAAK